MTIHWFNPLVWIAFMLMSTDMELSCDEKVLKVMNEDVKKPYANSLLSLAVGKHILNGSPIAFGEKNIKNRIKNVLKYKKPGIRVIAVCIIIVAVAGIGLMTNPIKKRANDGISTAKQKAHSVIFLNPFYSVTKDTFLNDRKENEYLFSDEIFEIDSVISFDKILVINPKYKEEYVGEQVKVVGDMVIDISNYSSKKCYRVLTSDNNDTGYIIYELDNETWISHWGWYGENKDAWLCEYILRVI